MISIKSIIFFAKLFYRNILNKKITLLKIKALISNLSFAFLRIPRVKYGPAAMWVEAANFCNLSCKGCWVPSLSKKLTPKAMDIEMYKKLIDETSDTLIMIMLQMSGEPFLNKNIFEMMSYANKKKIVVWTSTNGSFPTPDEWGENIVRTGIDTLYFSISGIKQADYERYHRKGNISYVLDNVKKIQAAKRKLGSRTPYIFFRILLNGHENNSFEEIKKVANDLKVKLHIRYVCLEYVFNGLDDPDKKKIIISCSKEPKTIINHCLGLWLAPAVQSNGEVLPCCLNQLGIPNFGNIYESKFDKVWKGEKFNNFRKNMLIDRKKLGGCAYCDNSIGFKDKFAEEKKVIQVNFINE